MSEKIKELYQDFGNIVEIENARTDNEKVYMFECNPNKVARESKLLKAMGNFVFLVVEDSSGYIKMVCYGLTKGVDIGSEPLKILNEVNSRLIFGKFLLDSDDDVNWEIYYKLSKTEKEEIKDYAYSCLWGITILAEKTINNG